MSNKFNTYNNSEDLATEYTLEKIHDVLETGIVVSSITGIVDTSTNITNLVDCSANITNLVDVSANITNLVDTSTNITNLVDTSTNIIAIGSNPISVNAGNLDNGVQRVSEAIDSSLNVTQNSALTELQAINTNTTSLSLVPSLGFGYEVRSLAISGLEPWSASSHLEDLAGTETLIIPELDIDDSGDFLVNTSGSAQTYYVISSNTNDDIAATGARSIFIEGVNAVGAIINETLNMTAAVYTATANQYTNINKFHVTVTGATNSNEGVILLAGTNVGTIATNLEKLGSIGIGLNSGTLSSYEVPADRELYMTSSRLLTSIAGTAQEIRLRIYIFRNITSLIYQSSLIIIAGTTGELDLGFEGSEPLVAGDICYFTVERTASTATLSVALRVEGYLKTV